MAFWFAGKDPPYPDQGKIPLVLTRYRWTPEAIAIDMQGVTVHDALQVVYSSLWVPSVLGTVHSGALVTEGHYYAFV